MLENEDATVVDIEDSENETKPDNFLERIAALVADQPNGKRSQLRRLYPFTRHEADGIVIDILVAADVAVPTNPDPFQKWRLLVHCAALLSGTGNKGERPHRNTARLGEILWNCGFKEERLLRLTSARGSILETLLARTIRRIAQAGEGPVNLNTVFGLVSDNGRTADSARLRLAREYYTAKARSEKEISSDD